MPSGMAHPASTIDPIVREGPHHADGPSPTLRLHLAWTRPALAGTERAVVKGGVVRLTHHPASIAERLARSTSTPASSPCQPTGARTSGRIRRPRQTRTQGASAYQVRYTSDTLSLNVATSGVCIIACLHRFLDVSLVATVTRHTRQLYCVYLARGSRTWA